jgi:hypothetical protein
MPIIDDRKYTSALTAAVGPEEVLARPAGLRGKT